VSKYTRWYPPSVNPHRVGWYPTECICGKRHYWDGLAWYYKNPQGKMIPWVAIRWRGLSEKYNGEDTDAGNNRR
jgi:hypothetical protein